MFNKKPITSDSLQQDSQNVLSVFRKAISDLGDIVSKANAQKEVKLEEAKQAKLEAAQLEQLSNDNTKVIENINNLLNN